jgi:transcription-repair coupling factor (superfamily II helicase)
MTVQGFLDFFKTRDYFSEVQSFLDSNPQSKINGLQHSLTTITISNYLNEKNSNQLVICENKEEAIYFLNDFQQFLGEELCYFYPGSYRRPYELEDTDNANVLFRAETINRLSQANKASVIVTYSDALFEKVVDKTTLQEHIQTIAVGETLDRDFITEFLFDCEFERVDFVYEPGQFSVRGEIIDVFSFSDDFPYRIQFFDDEIESIRRFNPGDQKSINSIQKFSIVPNIENKTIKNRVSIFRYLQENSTIWTGNIGLVKDQLDNYFVKAHTVFEEKQLERTTQVTDPRILFYTGKDFIDDLKKYTSVEFGSQNFFDAPKLSLDIKPQRSFNKDFSYLSTQFEQWHQEGEMIILSCSGQKQIQRFEEIFEELGKQNLEFTPLLLPLYQGFELKGVKVLTDHQIFERYHKYKLKNQDFKKNQFSLEELSKLEMGDFVTHIDHGIGTFGGLQKIDNNGKKQEVIKLIYKNNDILYVSIHSLHKISKYNSKEGKAPTINQIGSPKWQKLKNTTKQKIKKIAFNLIEVYAKRKTAKGFAYSPDNYLMHELEASFVFDETPDQMKAIQDIKADLENTTPMDRLVCGDVGFGKTEVAIRAAFKAVCDSKQVVVLVPTTILALQHYKSFKKRMKNLPVRVDYINRFKSSKQQKQTLKDLAEGKLDIIIGTHRVVGKDVKFKDLGLLIIDEEQKFGVSVKDKLKSLKTNIDTLTLTATPIPRTLQFSLMAARDLSVMTTPPANRYPVETNLVGFNEETLRDAIRYEIERGGQVYIINNRIENLTEVAGMVQRLVPDAKVSIGHGQMDGTKLEQIMMDFIEGESDVLIATTIIENGLDVPNANTILIMNANNFGLSDLHQMRGRVGRSNKKAFCYLITPPLSTLSSDSRKRLQALEQHSDLGSGFHIAMKDLEIRGAGDLLGGEQSGFISDIGFETYHKILNEAVRELKENEFKELYEEEDIEFVQECQLDTDFELLIPTNYVNNISERLKLYHDLSKSTEEKDLEVFEKELEDRFGKIPKQTSELINSVPLKWLGKELGIYKLVIKSGKMIAYFPTDPEDNYYASDVFQNILQTVQTMPKICRLKQKGTKLSLVFENVTTIAKARQLLLRIQPSEKVK